MIKNLLDWSEKHKMNCSYKKLKTPFLRSAPPLGDNFFDGVAKDAQKVMNREIRLDELKRSCDAGVRPRIVF